MTTERQKRGWRRKNWRRKVTEGKKARGYRKPREEGLKVVEQEVGL